MKVIKAGHKPGQRYQRTTYDMDGRVLIPGTRQHNRSELEGKQKDKHIPPSGSKATPAPKGEGMAPLSKAKADAAKETSRQELPANATDIGHETTEPKNAMESPRMSKRALFPGMRRAKSVLVGAPQPTKGV